MAVATIAAIATIAAVGAAYHQSRQGRRQAQDAERDQENAVKAENRRLDTEKEIANNTAASRMARARQRALAAGGGYNSSINTSPLGLSSVTGKQKLGE